MRHLKILSAIWGVVIIFFCPIVYAQPQVGEKIPDFTAYTLEGNRISLKDYLEKKGQKVLILYFFPSGVNPAREISNISNRYRINMVLMDLKC